MLAAIATEYQAIAPNTEILDNSIENENLMGKVYDKMISYYWMNIDRAEQWIAMERSINFELYHR